MHKRTKALQIPMSVKRKVYERDGGCCIWCGCPGDPVVHFIAKSQGGRGIEENIVCGCYFCHTQYDQTDQRERYRDKAREYLKSKYPDWDESNLYYKKWE